MTISGIVVAKLTTVAPINASLIPVTSLSFKQTSTTISPPLTTRKIAIINIAVTKTVCIL